MIIVSVSLICNMVRRLKKTGISIILICLVGAIHAQNRATDMSGWLGLAIKQKISDKLSYRIMGRVRATENMTLLKSYYVDAGLYYNFKPNFSISLNYVYSPSKVSDGYFRTYHQYYTSINNKININNYWYFSNRIIFQHTSSFFIIDQGYKPYSRTDAREKLTLNRRLTRKDRVYIADELMTTLFIPDVDLKRNRLYLGVNHKFTKQLSVDAFFLLQSTFNRKNSNSDLFVYGVTINYKFRKMMDDD
ncbi:MAG: DUF2490 domain-containing protein [Bacteroidota bacterium]